MNHFPNAPANFDDPLRELYKLAAGDCCINEATWRRS